MLESDSCPNDPSNGSGLCVGQIFKVTLSTSTGLWTADSGSEVQTSGLNGVCQATYDDCIGGPGVAAAAQLPTATGTIENASLNQPATRYVTFTVTATVNQPAITAVSNTCSCNQPNPHGYTGFVDQNSEFTQSKETLYVYILESDC
jgi:hypothetical protein